MKTSRGRALAFGFAWPTLVACTALGAAAATTLAPTTAHAAGALRVKSTEVTEVSGGWHIYVTLELPKAPAIAHVPMKFLFTKTAVFERSLVDNHKDPVTNRMTVTGQQPMVESLDVDFADGTGKVFKGTRYDFTLTRVRGYEAGEYKFQVRTSDGVDIGSPATITLRGDNPVQDRRTMNFSAKDPGVKKVGDGNGPAKAPGGAMDYDAAVPTNDVEATGSAAPFIPPSAYDKTPEEEIKTKPGGCGCSVPGTTSMGAFALIPALGLVGLARLRKRSRG
ncbi:MAG: hypothetical protein U0169_03165 [Polyangiaceae bacterium]